MSKRIFEDEEGNPLKTTWRTIETWLYRYKLHGPTAMEPKERSDKGKPRKISHEELITICARLGILLCHTNVRYEAPKDLRGSKVQVRYDRQSLEKVIVFYKDQRMGQAQRLDPVANDRASTRPENLTPKYPPS